MNKIVVLTIAAVFAASCADRGIVDNSTLETAGLNAAASGLPGAPV